MRVHTYFEQVPGMVFPGKLIQLWEDSWKRFGWEPWVLREKDARDHPGFAYFNERVSRFPTTNPSAYERACFLRHLAMANMEGALITDYDCINRGLTPQMLPGFTSGIVTLLEPTRVPCAVLGDEAGYENLCDILCEYKPSPGEHVSDMTIIRKTDLPRTNHCVEHLDSGRQIVDDPGDGWKTAPLIHFSTFSFSKLGWHGDKADMIRRVLDALPPLT